jgi:PAS domain S-box-containing protein
MSTVVRTKGFSLSTLVSAVRGGSLSESPVLSAAAYDPDAGELARLRESEARLKQVADTAPVLIRMASPNGMVTYLNQRWLNFTGRPFSVERGNGWRDGIHADDRGRYQKTCDTALVDQRAYQAEFRLRRHDGQYRWLLDVGTPTHDPAGLFTGYVGSCVDITDQKNIEHALETVSGRLIEAQEQERSYLARELHDDINQRLALLAIELEQLRLDLPGSRKDLVRRVDSIRHATLDISRDVQALSHELHSSKLDFLGLVPAFSSFCREFSKKKNVEMFFTHAGVPSTLPQAVSLCLFRVLQEASHNVVKHSGVRRFEVDLRGTGSHLRLTIRDAGRGFDTAAAVNSRGLGLISMRERLNLVGGTLSIQARPSHGTEIVAEVALNQS